MKDLILFENVSKYKIDIDNKKKLLDLLLFRKNINNSKEILFKDISFELKKGKNLGIYGEEGSGKSTLLKLIEGKILPDKGNVFINTLKIGNAISGKSGLRFDLSVRDNIFIKSMLHGANKEEIEHKLDQILEFAEFDKYSLEKKLNSFSSLLQAQLIFSIVTAYDYDIFLFDEKIEVGKKNFIIKCKNRIKKMSLNTSIIIASKNKDKIHEYCDKILILVKE